MPKKLLSEDQLNKLQEVGQVSLAQLNHLLERDDVAPADVESLYDELEERGITVIQEPEEQTASLSSSAAQTTKIPSDLDEVLASLADLETLMERWNRVTETTSSADDTETEGSNVIENGLEQFLNRVGQLPLLDEAEERELLRQVREGDENESRDARQKLMEFNQRLVFFIAKRYAGRTKLPLQDLLQEGTLGLAKAIDNFGADRHGRLSSYATWWIRRSIRRAVEDNERSMRLPGEFYAAIHQLQTLQAELTQELGHNPTLDELAEAADMPLAKVEAILRAGRAPLSLEQPVGEGNELGESLYGDAALSDGIDLSHEELQGELAVALATLSENERVVVEKRYGIGDYEDNGAMATEDVARELGFSTEKTRRLEIKALRKLRRRSKNADFGDILD